MTLAQGAVKFDFLGLRNLSIIDQTVTLINAKRLPKSPLDITLIPMIDKNIPITLSRRHHRGFSIGIGRDEKTDP